MCPNDLAGRARVGQYAGVFPLTPVITQQQEKPDEQHLWRRSSTSKIRGRVDHLWDLPGQTVRRCWLLYIIMTYYFLRISSHLFWQGRGPYILWFPQKAQWFLNKRSNFQENASFFRKAQEFSKKHKLSRTHRIFQASAQFIGKMQNSSKHKSFKGTVAWDGFLA